MNRSVERNAATDPFPRMLALLIANSYRPVNVDDADPILRLAVIKKPPQGHTRPFGGFVSAPPGNSASHVAPRD